MILRFIENDEAIVQRASAHKRERSDLDDPAFDELLGAFHVGHIEQRVIERPNIRIHLLGEGPRQVAQALPRLPLPGALRMMRPTSLRSSGSHGHSHGKIGLAGARRPDAEGDGVLADGVDVAFLARRLRT